MRYNNHLNYRRRKQFLFRVRLFFVGLIALGIAVGVWIYFDNRPDSHANSEDATTSAPTSSYFAPSVKVFRSPYFQFQANETWAEVPAESTPNKFVYRSLRSTLIEHELTIYVNQVPTNLMPTHVLPVAVKANRELAPNNVSTHCKDSVSAADQLRDVSQTTKDKVTFTCNSQSAAYNVIVGRVDGDTSINLQRPDGTNAVYVIYYRDLRAVPDSSQIVPIVSTFQSR